MGVELEFRLYLSYCDYLVEKGVGLIGCPILSFSLGVTKLELRKCVTKLKLVEKGVGLLGCPILSFSLGVTSELLFRRYF